jgi:hypothetical protein
LESGFERLAAGDHLAQSDSSFDHDGSVPLEGGKEHILARQQPLEPLQHRAPLSR